MSRTITSTEIESVIKTLPVSKSPREHDIRGVFYQMFTEELTPILLKIYLKIPKKGTFLKSFYEPSITLIPILGKKKKGKKEKYRPISLINRFKHLQQNTSKLTPMIN